MSASPCWLELSDCPDSAQQTKEKESNQQEGRWLQMWVNTFSRFSTGKDLFFFLSVNLVNAKCGSVFYLDRASYR